MPYKLTPVHLAAVLKLSGPERYNYAIKRIADWEEVWLIRSDDGFCMLGHRTEGRDVEAVPVWPHPDLARKACVGDWSDCKPVLIELDEFLEKWIPGLVRDGRVIAVFPTPKGDQAASPVVPPTRFEDDLQPFLDQD